MKRVALMARKFSVDSQVASAMIIGYFVLLTACGFSIYKNATHQHDDNPVTATHQQQTGSTVQMTN